MPQRAVLNTMAHIVYGSDFPHSPAKVVLAKKKHLDENPKYKDLLLKIYGENETNCLGN